ncbi:MAG TPA: hypothetical protein V6D07_01745 [Trichocoleus sp.]
MSNPNSPNVSSTATGDTNLGHTSRRLTHQINNLLGASEEPNPTLRDLLTQLQQAIEAEPSLNNAQKAEALLEIAELSTAGQAPDEGPMQMLAKRALQALKGTTAPLADTAKLSVALQDLLPRLTAIFSL